VWGGAGGNARLEQAAVGVRVLELQRLDAARVVQEARELAVRRAVGERRLREQLVGLVEQAVVEVVAQQRVQEHRLAGGVVVEARRAVVREEARAELAQLPRALVRPARVEVNLLGDRVERPPVVRRQPVERERRAADGGLERAAVELEEQHEQRVVELRLGRDRRRALLLLGALLRRRRRARRQRRERREQRLAQRVRRREERRRRLLDDGRRLRRVRLRRLPHHRQRAQRLRDEAALARADPPVDVGEGGRQCLLRVDRRRRRLRRRGRRVHGHRLRHCRVGAVRRSRSVPILRRGSVRELRRPRRSTVGGCRLL
jgi:hypothetical protein